MRMRKIAIMFAACLAVLSVYAQSVSPKFEPGEVEATVVYHHPGEAFFFAQTADGTSWRIEAANLKDATNVKERMRVIAHGEILQNAAVPQMRNAKVEIQGTGFAVPPPIKMTPEELHAIGSDDTEWRRSWYGKIVTTSGVVRDINRRATYTQLVIGPESAPVMVSLPIDRAKPLPAKLETGVGISVTGVGVYRIVKDDSGNWTPVHDIEVRLRGKEGLEFVTPPPFWTPGRMLAAFGAFALAMFAALGLIQHRRVRERIAAEATTRERLRLSHDLHDNLQQLLASCSFSLAATTMAVQDGASREEVLSGLNDVELSLQRTQAGLRAALWSISEEAEGPSRISDLMRYAAGRLAHWENAVELSFAGKEPSIGNKHAGSLLMILQEAVGNAMRRGGADKVRVAFLFGDNEITMTVADNGRGFDTAVLDSPAKCVGMGIRGMKQRAASLGGEFTIDSTPGKGTTITVKLPI